MHGGSFYKESSHCERSSSCRFCFPSTFERLQAATTNERVVFVVVAGQLTTVLQHIKSARAAEQLALWKRESTSKSPTEKTYG